MLNKNKTWDKTKRCFIDTPDKMSSFFDDIEELCEKYNFSIAHEDCHGGFLIEEYSQNNMEWLRDASKNYEENEEWQDGYDSFKANYKNRLKADLKAILVELQLEIEELYPEHQCSGELTGFADAIETITPIIQQKIDKLKGGNEEQKETEFHCGIEESGGHAYNCNDCPNKCEEYYQWEKEFKSMTRK